MFAKVARYAVRNLFKQSVVENWGNPSYSWGGGRKIMNLRPEVNWGKVIKTLSQKQSANKSIVGVAQHLLSMLKALASIPKYCSSSNNSMPLLLKAYYLAYFQSKHFFSLIF
jgi:hypothetical protein